MRSTTGSPASATPTERARRRREGVRILGVTKSTGGVAVYNRTLIEHLRDRGYGVGVLCLSEGNESYARALAARGIPTRTMGMARYSIAPVSDLRLAIRLVRHLRRHPVDLILAHGAKAGFLCRLAGRLSGIPVIYVMHSMPFLRRVQGRRAIGYRQLERIGSLLGGHIVAISGSMRDELRRRRIAPVSGVTVIQTGIDPAKLEPLHDRAAARRALGLEVHRPVIGWAGRLNPQKAPLDFVRAAELVARSVPNVQFYMAGEGPLAGDVLALADRVGLGKQLIVGGWQNDVAAMFSAFDIYCATSRWEGLPLTLLEAMTAQRAVVATAVDGVIEVIRDGVEGYLVDVADHRSMARRIEPLLLDEARRAELGRAAKARVAACFTVERMMESWEDLIDRQLAAKRGASTDA